MVLLVSYKGHVTFSDLEFKTLSDILYVPGVKTNLFSVGGLTDLGHNIIFTSKICVIFDILHPDRIYLRATRNPRTKLYKLAAKTVVSKHLTLSAATKTHAFVDAIDLWHRRFAHVNMQSLYHMTTQNLVNGVRALPYLK